MPLMLEIHGDTVSVDQYNTTLLFTFFTNNSQYLSAVLDK